MTGFRWALRMTFAALVGLGAWGGSTAALAQAFPDHPVRLIVPFPPGGSTDVLARILGERLSAKWNGAQIVIDNRPGANTLLGATAAAHAPADGYTLFMPIDFTLTMNQALYSKLPYDPANDFVPISLLTEQSLLVSVNPKVPVHDMDEFVKYAKAHPGKLTYGTGAIISQVGGEMLKRMAGIDMVQVPFKGSQPTLQALLAGDIDMTVSDLLPYFPYLKNGQLVGLATTGEVRAESLPDLTTMDAAGFKGFNVRSWFGLVAPVGTPGALVQKIGDDVRAVLADANVRQKLAAVGLETVGSTSAEFTDVIKRDTATYGRIIKEAGIKLD